MEVSCQFHALTTLTQGKAATMHWIGGWVGLRAGVDTSEKTEISCSSQKLRHESSVFPACSLITITSCQLSSTEQDTSIATVVKTWLHNDWTYNKLWFDSQQLQETYLWFKASSMVMGIIQTIFNWHWGPSTRGTKWLGLKRITHCLSSSKVKNDSNYTSTALHASTLHRGTLTISGGR